MNVQPPVAAELWQQVPPPVQSALLEAWEQAEQRRHSLEEQLRQLRDRLDRKDIPPAFVPPVLTPLDKQVLVAPAQETKLSRGRLRRHHRTPAEKRQRRWEKLVEVGQRYFFWPAVVLAVVLILWVVLLLINPGSR